MAYGQSGHLAVSFQNSFGTSTTNSAHFIPIISESLTEGIGQMVEKNMYGRLSEAPTHEGLHSIAGDIRTEAHPIGCGVLFKSALGRVTTTPQGAAFRHEFLPLTEDWDQFAAVPPTTIKVHRDVGSSFLYYDMLASALNLEMAHGQFFSASINMVGGRFSQQAAALPAYPLGRPWSWDVSSASYDGAAVTDLRQLSLTFDNQLAAHHTLSSGKYPQRIKRSAAQTVGVEGTLLFQDQVLFNEFRNQTEKRLVLHFAGETVATSYQNALTIDIPRLRFSEFSPQLAGPGQLEVSFSAKGIFDPTSGYALRVTLTNTHPGY